MVNICHYPGDSFHRLPFRYGWTIVNRWLVLLNIDINKPTETLRQKSYRVCSAHFNKANFVLSKSPADPKNSLKTYLKKNEVPRVEKLATDSAELGKQTECGIFKTLSRSSTSSSGSTSSLGTGSGWAERKWLVDETKLLELFKTCSQCGTAIDEKKTSSHGESCPDQRKCPETIFSPVLQAYLLESIPHRHSYISYNNTHPIY
uniref:THAP-type domain-containing protein n=1 Tax=Sparus aurata TaxID=8175 RepID=A0A671XXM4_SPAAU